MLSSKPLTTQPVYRLPDHTCYLPIPLEFRSHNWSGMPQPISSHSQKSSCELHRNKWSCPVTACRRRRSGSGSAPGLLYPISLDCRRGLDHSLGARSEARSQVQDLQSLTPWILFLLSGWWWMSFRLHCLQSVKCLRTIVLLLLKPFYNIFNFQSTNYKD